jgi:alpha-galactosidase
MKKYLTRGQAAERLPRGTEAEYRLTPIEGNAAAGTPAAASGAWWMNHGLDFGEDFRGDFQAAAFRLDKK